jgi:hypothetical protein
VILTRELLGRQSVKVHEIVLVLRFKFALVDCSFKLTSDVMLKIEICCLHS